MSQRPKKVPRPPAPKTIANGTHVDDVDARCEVPLELPGDQTIAAALKDAQRERIRFLATDPRALVGYILALVIAKIVGVDL